MEALAKLLKPRTVALVGASADTAKLTGRPLAYLEKYGFTGTVYPVNPRYEAIGAHRCYPDIAALPQPPDVAIVLLGASKVTDAVRQLARIGSPQIGTMVKGVQEIARRAAG